jgi:uncharacterized repeat protein (TIGR03803 family)
MNPSSRPLPMPSSFAHLGAALSLILTLVVVPGSWAGCKYKVLYSFQGGSDGAMPGGALTLGKAGDLYGTTIVGGTNQRDCTGDGGTGCGTVFRLTRRWDGTWKETVLYRFQGSYNGYSDGAGPVGGPMVFGPSGSLLGTTDYGGDSMGDGTVFELTPQSSGQWTESVLHRFDEADGQSPESGLSSDKAGSFYGTTATGGTSNGGMGGVAFRVTRHSGQWRESTVYTFCSQNHCSDGAFPEDALLSGPDGSLYGTTWGGGQGSPHCINGFGCGTVFKLARDQKGRWHETVLHAFTPAEGSYPRAGLVADSKGNLYGTTTINGAFGYGTVFELSPTSKGCWKYRILHSFRSGSHYGLGSDATRLVFDAAGNLYGAVWGGARGSCGGAGCGVFYKLTLGRHGKWQYRVLHNFSGGTDGSEPLSDLIIDQEGILYGTAEAGGINDNGVVFEIIP